jgi:hypothetical protein
MTHSPYFSVELVKELDMMRNVLRYFKPSLPDQGTLSTLDKMWFLHLHQYLLWDLWSVRLIPNMGFELRRFNREEYCGSECVVRLCSGLWCHQFIREADQGFESKFLFLFNHTCHHIYLATWILWHIIFITVGVTNTTNTFCSCLFTFIYYLVLSILVKL